MEIVGTNLTRQAYEALAIRYVKPALFKGESDLYATKWWDYRPWHPLQATYHFAHAYKLAMRRAIMQRTDLYRGLNAKGLAHEDFLQCSPATITGMWKARQVADGIGCPYDFYCSQAMKYAQKRDWQYLPSPQQLYPKAPKFADDIGMVDEIILAWRDRTVTRIVSAESSFFQADAYIGNQHQIEHQAHLVQALRNHPHKCLLLASMVYEQKILLPEVAEKAFGNDTLRAARRFVDEDNL